MQAAGARRAELRRPWPTDHSSEVDTALACSCTCPGNCVPGRAEALSRQVGVKSCPRSQKLGAKGEAGTEPSPRAPWKRGFWVE